MASRHARVHPETVLRIERSMGTLGTAAIAAMDERLPWFRKMSAENRSWLGLAHWKLRVSRVSVTSWLFDVQLYW